jgi:WD40 repeat protein
VPLADTPAGHLRRYDERAVISPDGRRIATRDGDSVRLWDTLTGQEVMTLRASGALKGGLAFLADGTQLAAGGADGTVTVWEAPPVP